MTILHATELNTGPDPLVFVHGLFGQGKNFGMIAKALTSHRCLLVDAPNHGLSPWTEIFDYGLFAEMLAQTIQSRFGNQPVAVAGHSMGAKIAMRLALDHPELITKLVVLDMAPAHLGSTHEFSEIISALRSLNLEAITSRGQADQVLAGRIPDKTIRAFLLQSLHHGDEGWRWLLNLELLDASLDLLAAWPQAEYDSWSGPVLWLVGEHSPLHPEKHTAAMHSFFPATRLQIISGARHWIHADQPAQVVQAIADFC